MEKQLDIFDELESDSEEIQKLAIETNSDKLKALVNMANELLEQQKVAAEIEEALKQVKGKINSLSFYSIPELMQELGLSALELDTGEIVSVKGDVSVSIKKGMNEEAFAYLAKEGYEAIIKTLVKVDVDRELASVVVAEIKNAGYDPVIEEKIHPQTLKATLKNLRQEQGADIPEDVFDFYEYNKTLIK